MKFKYWAMLFFLAGIFSFSYYILEKEKTLLKSCSQESNAIVLDNYSTRNKRNTVKYMYFVSGNKYTSSEVIDDNRIDFYNIGDTIKIKYACKSINVSRIINK